MISKWTPYRWIATNLIGRVVSTAFIANTVLSGLCLPTCIAQDYVDGNLVLLNENAGWCWFQDERVVYDSTSNQLLASTVANGSGFDGRKREADIDVTCWNLLDGTIALHTAGKRVSYQCGDDHNAGAIWIRPDGRYLHVWTGHNESSRRCFFRVSSQEHDARQWQSEKSFHWPSIGNPDLEQSHSATYNNLHFLAEERGGNGRLFNFVRESQRSPNIAYSDDYGETWTYGGKLTRTRSPSSYSNGYLKYCSNGHDRIDFITTEHHPRNYNTSIYHGYIRHGKSYDTFGTLVDDNIFDELAPAPEEFSLVFRSSLEDGISDDVEYHRAWTVDLERDSEGRPVALFTTRFGTSQTIRTSGEKDHRLFYARFDGQFWKTHEIARMGGPLWSQEEDYTGLATVHPNHANIAVISTNFDPQDGRLTPKHELYRGETFDDGASWKWTALTRDSTVSNLRPSIPSIDTSTTVICWLRGTYDSQSSFDQALVGIVDNRDTRIRSTRFVDASPMNTIQSGRPSEIRDGVGINGASYVAKGLPTDETGVSLETTVEGMESGIHDLHAYFWSRVYEDWRVQCSLDGGSSRTFRRNSAQIAPKMSGIGNTRDGLVLYRVCIGKVEVKSRSDIPIKIRWHPEGWEIAFDGIGVTSYE